MRTLIIIVVYEESIYKVSNPNKIYKLSIDKIY